MRTLKRSSDNIIKYYEDTFKTIFKDSWNTFKTDKYDIVFMYPLKFAESDKFTYEELDPAEDCKFQGYFYCEKAY